MVWEVCPHIEHPGEKRGSYCRTMQDAYEHLQQVIKIFADDPSIDEYDFSMTAVKMRLGDFIEAEGN